MDAFRKDYYISPIFKICMVFYIFRLKALLYINIISNFTAGFKKKPLKNP